MTDAAPRTPQQDLLDEYADRPAGDECTCPATGCPLHGKCRVCVAWHRDKARKPLPHCLRDANRPPKTGE